MGKVTNYFPRYWDSAAIRANPEKFAEALEPFMGEIAARTAADKIGLSDGMTDLADNDQQIGFTPGAESVNRLWLQRRASPMWEQLHRHITHTTYWQRWLEDHRVILNALKRKDPVAARHAMWQHLENVRETLLALSDVDAPEFDGYLFQSLPINIPPAQ